MKNIFHSLLLIAFLGGIFAPACGFAWGVNGAFNGGGNFSVVEICTAKGIEHKIVANSDNPDAPTTPTAPNLSDQCQFCFSHTHMTAILPQEDAPAVIAYIMQKQRFQFYELIIIAQTTSHEQPRGPPILT